MAMKQLGADATPEQLRARINELTGHYARHQSYPEDDQARHRDYLEAHKEAHIALDARVMQLETKIEDLDKAKQMYRVAVVEKEDLEAVTDAPISVSGGAPTAENSI